MGTSESVIRLMTRLATQHQAVNLSQGFPEECPDYEMVWGAIASTLGGTSEHIERLEKLTLSEIMKQMACGREEFLNIQLKDLLSFLQNPRDELNQYSFPFGLSELRQAVSKYTRRFYDFQVDPETEITIVLGATEGLACVLRALCEPGDGIIIFQPFHEMYPSQGEIFGLRPEYVTLRENPEMLGWEMDKQELENAVRRNVKAIILNSPHNPTGKVFTKEELIYLSDLCQKHDLLVITDEIYEHIIYEDHRHYSLATFDGMRDRTIVINSISKSGNATGWRVGWVISPAAYTTPIRAIHDTLVIQSPTPLQRGAVQLLQLEDRFYQDIAKTYEQKRATLMTALRRVGFRVTPPEGAYYLFANYREVPVLKELNSVDAAMYLIRKIGVAAVPGNSFYRQGNEGNNYLRFAFCRSLDTLQLAANRLGSLTI